MEFIYIVLIRPGTRISRTLGLLGNLSYPHVAISLEPQLATMYSFGRQRLYNPLIGGFIEEHPNCGLYRNRDPQCKVIRVAVSPVKYEKLRLYLRFAKNNTHLLTYNFPGLLFTKLNRPHHLSIRYTCSQFVGWLLEQSQVCHFTRDVSVITPRDFEQLDGEIIYEGPLNAIPMPTSCVG